MNDAMMIHHKPDLTTSLKVPDMHQDTFSKATFGFWLYLLSDCLLFATLFTTYVVLLKETFGGPSAKELFELPLAFIETMVLLLSSITCGMAVLSAVKSKKNATIIAWLSVTFLLGISFIFLEFSEFSQLISQGHDWKKSAFLSAFFTLVGTHGLHVSVGLLWLLTMIGQVFFKGITSETFRRLVIFSLFWHFLDLIWIFIFTFVYLLGVI